MNASRVIGRDFARRLLRNRLAAAGGAVVSSEGIRGSVATVRPKPSAAAFVDWLMREAVEHHIALAYGAWLSDLETFCEFTGIRYITPRC